jgi:Tfp pilus assembly protein PilN
MRYRMNLVPDSYREKKVVDLGRMALVLLLAGWTALLAMLGILYQERVLALRKGVALLAYQKSRLALEEGATQKALDRIAGIRDRDLAEREVLSQLDGFLVDRVLWSRVMAQATFLVPEGAWLTSISSSGAGGRRTITFKGNALSNQWVARFLFFLENHPEFTAVRLGYARQAGAGRGETCEFEVSAELAPRLGKV